MKVAVLFPGQGSQYVGMTKELIEEFPHTRQVFEEASEAIKINLLKLCLEGPESDLRLTYNVQPCILATSYSWFSVLEKKLGLVPTAGAGHSLGEYSALTSAKAVSLFDAIKLVRTRGKLMQEAVPPDKGMMAALIGLEDDKVEELCRLASEGEESLVVPANYNAPNQVVIAGHKGAVERALNLGKGQPEHPDLKVRKAIPLNVSAPFHSPLMKKVATTFFEQLKLISWRNPSFPVASNLDGKMRSKADWPELLRDQIDHPVRWATCAQSVNQLEIDKWVEVGPGKVLGGLVSRIVSGAKIYSVDSAESFKNFEKEMS